jgi:hypothetical protein
MGNCLVVEFKFRPKEKVKDPLGVVGIVTMVGVSMESPDPQYYVKTKTGSAWWCEEQLSVPSSLDEAISK